MKILALQGSPRAAGNTQTLLDAVLAEAMNAGAATEVIQLSRLDDLTGCHECYACQQYTTEPGCALDDDMMQIYSRALTSDVLVWATPVFCWSPSWLLKMVMDRFFCMFKFGDHEVTSLLEGRRSAAVITAGGKADDGARMVEEIFQHFARFARSEWLGTLTALEIAESADLRADEALMTRARDFGRLLVA